MRMTKVGRQYNKAWLMEEQSLKEILSEMHDAQLPDMAMEPVSTEPTIIDNVAIIPIEGVLSWNITPIEAFFGFSDIEIIARQVQNALVNPDVTGIVYTCNSPGGSSDHIMEVGQLIAGAKLIKPTIAHINGGCFSACYWLAAGANAIYSDLSGEAGSIGVMMPVVTEKGLWDMSGVKMTVIKSSELKGLGTPGTDLSDTQIAELQRGVDYLYGKFKAHVLENRPQVKQEALEARTYYAEEAIPVGLIDNIAGLNDAIRDVKLLASIR